MSANSANEARRNRSRLIRQVNDDHAPIEVVPKNGSAVLISQADYDAIVETAYLLRNRSGADRLVASLQRARRGEIELHELHEE